MVKIEKAEPEEVKMAAVVQNGEQKNIGRFTGEGHNTLYRRDGQISKIGDFKGGRLWRGKVYHYDGDGILGGISIYKKGKYQGEGVIEEGQ